MAIPNCYWGNEIVPSLFIEALERGIPEPSENCPFCGWYDKVKDEFK